MTATIDKSDTNIVLQFSQDLMRIPGYNVNLNQIALWGLVISPLSKFALATRPVGVTFIRGMLYLLTWRIAQHHFRNYAGYRQQYTLPG